MSQHGQCKKDITPLLMHWSYVFLALTHRYVIAKIQIWSSAPELFQYFVTSCRPFSMRSYHHDDTSNHHEPEELPADVYIYHQISDIRCTLAGYEIVDHTDVVGASPVSAAPTTSSFLPLSPNWARGVLSSPAGRAGGRALPHTVTALLGAVLIGSRSNLVGTILGAGSRMSSFMGDVAH